MRLLKLLVLNLIVLTLFATDSPFVGTWKLDVDRSTFPPGPSLMFETVQIEFSGNGLKTTANNADGHGVVTDLTFDSPLDGTPSPVVGSPTVDRISLKSVDNHTITAKATKDGKLVYTDQRVVSADGKTMTISRKGTTSDGTKYRTTMILERRH